MESGVDQYVKRVGSLIILIAGACAVAVMAHWIHVRELC